MAVAVLDARRDDRDRGLDCREEGSGRGRAAAMVGDLEHVDAGQPPPHEDRVDVLLDVAREEEAPPSDLKLEHDRDVVDARARVRRRLRDGSPVWPQDPEPPVVHAQAVTGHEAAARRPLTIEDAREGHVSGTGPRHARFVEVADAVPAEEPDQPRGVVLVGMGEDDDVEPAIPGGDARVQECAQAIGIRAAVDEDPAARRPRHEDGVPLPDIEDGHPRPPVRSSGGDATEGHEQPECEGEDRQLRSPGLRRPTVTAAGHEPAPRGPARS